MRHHHDIHVPETGCDLAARHETGEHHASVDRERLTAFGFALPACGGMSSNDQAANIGQERERPQEHVDALPGIQMAAVTDAR